MARRTAAVNAAAAATLLLLLLARAAAAAPAGLAADCIATPSDPSCRTFVLPESAVVEDLNSLCSAMHFMTGCSLYKACNATRATRTSISGRADICSPFQQLATICSRDPGMGGMAGCRRHYSSMCANGSVVPQCAAARGFGDLVTTEDANKLVLSICEEMDMDGCERCTPAWKEGKKWGGPNCDPFAVYGWLCVQMPDMWQCIGAGRWDAMCRADPTLYACVGNAPELTDKGWWRPGGPPVPPPPAPGGGGKGGGGGGDAGGGDSGGGGGSPFAPGPSMRMYFFSQLPFWLLFKEWTPGTAGELAGAWFAIFALGVLYELLQTLRYRIEASWLASEGRGGAGPQALVACGNGAAAGAGLGAAPSPPTPRAAPGSCGCGDVPITIPPQPSAHSGPGPLGEGAEGHIGGGSGGAANGGGCCSGARGHGDAEAASLRTPLAPAPPSPLAVHAPAKAGGPPVLPTAGGKPRGSAAAAWLRRQGRPGGPLDGTLLRRDAARAAMAFVTTAVGYALMLAAMSFHVAIFFAVCAGVGVGAGLFGRYRTLAAVAHQDCCC